MPTSVAVMYMEMFFYHYILIRYMCNIIKIKGSKEDSTRKMTDCKRTWENTVEEDTRAKSQVNDSQTITELENVETPLNLQIVMTETTKTAINYVHGI